MKKPHSIYIHLTNEQAELLKDLFVYVRSEAAKDAPGMLLAQVWDAASFYEGPARMRVGFVEHDIAKTVEHATSG